MPNNVWKSIILANQAGRSIGDSFSGVADALQARHAEELQQKLYQQKLADDMAQLAIKDPNTFAGSQAIQPGQTIDGQQSVKPLAFTPQQQEAMRSGQNIPDVPTVALGGRAFDPQAIKQADIEDELRKSQNQMKINEALYNMRPQLSTVVDPVTGQVSVIDKRQATATQVNNGSPIVGTKLTQKEIIDPATGIKKIVNLDASGRIVSDVGTSDVPRGQVIQDPTTGAVSVVNNILPQGIGAGQAAPVNQPATTGQNQQFRVNPKLPNIPAESVKEMADFKTLQDIVKSVEDNYDANFVGPYDSRLGSVRQMTGQGLTDKESNFRSALADAQNQILYLRSGKAITESEMSRLMKALPSEATSDEDFKVKLARFKGTLEETLKNRQAGFSASGYRTPQAQEQTQQQGQSAVDRLRAKHGL
jgi:hypothetical protein